MHRFKWKWDAIPTLNQFVASFVSPFRQKMSEVLDNEVVKNFPAGGIAHHPHGIMEFEQVRGSELQHMFLRLVG